ncbi:MAG: hypothetical protein WKG07_34050 [Hymenobacter sp.]
MNQRNYGNNDLHGPRPAARHPRGGHHRGRARQRHGRAGPGAGPWCAS